MDFHKILHYGQKVNRRGNKLRTKLCRLVMRVYYNCDIDFSAQIDESVKIGAGAVVLEDVPDYCTAVGVPARIIKREVINANGG